MARSLSPMAKRRRTANVEGDDGEEKGDFSSRAAATRRHAGWSLSARHRAGLLHPSRLCPPRDHPPNASIGPCLVIRPKADLALVVSLPGHPPRLPLG